MAIRDDVGRYVDDLVAIRRDLHAHPELAFEERRTARLVADTLRAYGVDEVHTGIAGTGVVGVVRGGGPGGSGRSNRAIGLRADMDALPITERNDFAHRSGTDGRMHACGHDGHTTMLLGAARYLADKRDFDGTVYLIFQPGEERGGGGRRMIEAGLFERFDCQSVYGMHNLPGVEVGRIAMRAGPCMASSDAFRIRVTGQGGHGAWPHLARDPVVVGAHIVTALQAIVSRLVDPLEPAVLSVAKFETGTAFNVIPDEATLIGTARSFDPDTRTLIEGEARRIAAQVATAFDARAEVAFMRGYPATINSDEETRVAARAAGLAVGDSNLSSDWPAQMGAEDFAYMLEKRPGCYIWLGNGVDGEAGGNSLHSPSYDFNDSAIPHGVAYWAALVETVLPKAA
ncbi:M20 aminoacylase family protein [Microbaculum marinum]|uniref:M20 aminoacylase family protein n=1 Tax=Microbaculum marinum TaxID=1764581 RepID=A0AAW9RY66_9HYPH